MAMTAPKMISMPKRVIMSPREVLVSPIMGARMIMAFVLVSMGMDVVLASVMVPMGVTVVLASVMVPVGVTVMVVIMVSNKSTLLVPSFTFNLNSKHPTSKMSLQQLSDRVQNGLVVAILGNLDAQGHHMVARAHFPHVGRMMTQNVWYIFNL